MSIDFPFSNETLMEKRGYTILMECGRIKF
jgi:hypothetical protein